MNPKTNLTEISIIIINWNTCQLLGECIDSIYAHAAELNPEIIVVDNASTDNSLTMLEEKYPEIILVENLENIGFARANNQGAKLSQAQFVLLLNSDAQLYPNALQKLLALAKQKPQAALIGARLLNPDGSFQASWSPFPNLWREFLILSSLGRRFTNNWYPSRGPEIEKGPQQVDYVEGACLFCRRAEYLKMGGLDESFFMYAEEVDLCYKTKKAGYQVWYDPDAKILHHGGASSLNRRTQREGDLYRSRIHFFRKNYGACQAIILTGMMYFFIMMKSTMHILLKLLSGGKKGRDVITMREFSRKLREE